MNILIHCRVKVKKILLKAFCEEEALDRFESYSSYQHSFYGVQYNRRIVFWEHIVEKDTLPCPEVESRWKEEKEECEKERP